MVQDSVNESWDYFIKINDSTELKMKTVFLSKIYYGDINNIVTVVERNQEVLIGNYPLPNGICDSWCYRKKNILIGDGSGNIYIISDDKKIYKGAKDKSWRVLPTLPNPQGDEENAKYRPVLVTYYKNHVYALQAYVGLAPSREQLYVYEENESNI